jgi:glycosyltransferase involved in cell wall biosynthesis
MAGNAITVITICFNNPAELIKTCQSVDTQTMPVFEHLIIDGSSKQDIKMYLEQNPQPAYRRWICERDRGIADAFNKGVKNARGTFIQFLNAADVYYDKTVIEKVVTAMSIHPEANWLHGKLNMLRGGIWVLIGKPFDKDKLYRGMRGTFHPTMFVKKDLFDAAGAFDERLKIAMDYDFLLRIASAPSYFLDFPLVSFDAAGISSTNYLESLKENKLCYERYNGKSLKLFFWQLRLKLLYYLLQSPIGNFLYRIKKGMGLENA